MTEGADRKTWDEGDARARQSGKRGLERRIEDY